MADTDRDREFRHQSLQDRETIVNYLMALVEGFKQGKLRVGSGEEELMLEPGGLLDLELHARRKGRQTRLSIRINWNTPAEDASTRLVIRPDSNQRNGRDS